MGFACEPCSALALMDVGPGRFPIPQWSLSPGFPWTWMRLPCWGDGCELIPAVQIGTFKAGEFKWL